MSKSVSGLCMRINSITSVRIYSANNSNQHKSNQESVPYIRNIETNTVSFGMRINYGIPAKLPQDLQVKIVNIHKNLDFIKNFFAKYTIKNPQLGSLIKKGYSDLIPKRQSGIVFRLPDSKDTIEIMRSQTRDNILYISIDNGSVDFNGIVVDGKDRLIANYLKRHAHMLPRELKYMNNERMVKAQPEKFINIADEKLQNYGDYIRKLESGEIPMPKVGMTPARKAWLEKDKENKIAVNKTEISQLRTAKLSETKTKTDSKLTKFVDRNPESKNRPVHKPPRSTSEVYAEFMTQKSKNFVRYITKLFSQKDIPPHLTPKTTPNGTILGFTLNTDDGGTLKVMKKVVGSYGSSMPYLSFEKVNKDKTMNFISIDMITNKILRTKDKGKPHISSDHIVYELTPDELKRRKIEEKLNYYMAQITKQQAETSLPETITVTEVIPAQPPKEIKTATKPQKITKTQKPKRIKDLGNVKDVDKLKEQMRSLGKKNGSIAAKEYFNAFRNQFITEMQTKMSEFNSKFQKFMDELSKI